MTATDWRSDAKVIAGVIADGWVGPWDRGAQADRIEHALLAFAERYATERVRQEREAVVQIVEACSGRRGDIAYEIVSAIRARGEGA